MDKRKRPTWRIMVSVEVEADSLPQAYGRVFRGMRGADPPGWARWGATGSVRGPDGNPIPEPEALAARTRYFADPVE